LFVVCKGGWCRTFCNWILITIRWLILVGGASMPRSAHSTSGALIGGCCSVSWFALLSRRTFPTKSAGTDASERRYPDVCQQKRENARQRARSRMSHQPLRVLV